MKTVEMPKAVASEIMQMILDNSSPVPITGCWMWMRALTPSNHAMVTFGPWRASRKDAPDGMLGKAMDPKPAHRLSLAAKMRRYLVGGSVDHLCEHPWCVNPDHLEHVTQQQNILRSKMHRMGMANSQHMKF